MFFKVTLCALLFLTTSAYPLHRNTREAPWADSRANQANHKTELSKNTDYKSQMDTSSLYSLEDEANKNLAATEVQHKLSMETERLRARLHQELAELRQKLSPSPSHVSSTLANIRERLAPLTQQLQSALSTNTQDLCAQVSLYLQRMETAVFQTDDSQTLHQKTLQWMTQTLDHSSSKMSGIYRDFHSQTREVMEHFKDSSGIEWQKVSSRLEHEVGVLQVEAQNRARMLIEEIASLQMTSQDYRARMTARMEEFCQNAELQNRLFRAQMGRLFVDLEEEHAAHTNSGLSASSSSLQHSGSLQEDFSLKLSSLIQGILHSVQ